MTGDNKINSEIQYTHEQYNTMRTAFLTAFPKIFTDIPFANKIFVETIRLACERGFSFQTEQFVAKLALELEARYKALNFILDKHIKTIGNNVIIIEIGAGLSPRKLEFNNFQFVEIDYPPMIEIKQKIYEMLGYPIRYDELIGADLTHPLDLKKIVQLVQKIKKGRSILMISEGLFWYLSRNAVQNLVECIHNLLSSSGGLWITGDCPTKFEIPHEDDYRSVIANSSKRQMNQPFSSFNDFEMFFNSIGFSVCQSQLEDWIKTKDLLSASIFSSSTDCTLNRLRTYTDVAELYVKF
jgi:O-methyltransferase involved in polyketide biosynthesis